MSFFQIDATTFSRALHTGSKIIYKKLLEAKVMVPQGVLNWALELELSDTYIRSGSNFARKCTRDIFAITFQFKIVSQILPTNEFLERYRVRDNNICSICLERDSTLHSVYECEKVASFINLIFEFLNANCKASLSIENSRDDYIFGLKGGNEALNQILLQLKIFNFYYIHEHPQTNNAVLQKSFFSKVRRVIFGEKVISMVKNKFEEFDDKWSNFLSIYDYRGPDYDFI